MQTKKAFSLVELLIVIAIIGILSSVVIINISNSKIKARDAKRKGDLNQIGLAFLNYHSVTDNYSIPGTGSQGLGEGWFSFQDGIAGGYPKSMAKGLIDAGYLSSTPIDPGLSDANAKTNGYYRQYMKYDCFKDPPTNSIKNGFAVFARLEKPTTKDDADYSEAMSHGCTDPASGHQTNYAIYFR